MLNHTTRLLILFPVAAGLVLSMTGCGAISNAVHKTHDERFADVAAAEQGWKGVSAPAWLPADATDIRNLATTDESHSVVLVRSSSALPSSCQEADRRAVPFDTTSWTPKLDRFPDRVERCGDYEVMPVDGGWFGWFSATEPGQVPSPAAR